MPAFKTAIDHDLDAVDPHPGVAFLRLHPPGLDEPARLFPGLQVHTGKIDGVAERQLAGFRHASHQPVCGPQVTFVDAGDADRSEEHTSELQSLMRISYAVFCLKKKISKKTTTDNKTHILK